jgi:sulfatase maturation enzyme AslB (radical SAM superfamily)
VYTLEIEATNQCNTRCLHCPHESISRPMGMMTWETFQAVADKVLAYGQTRAVDFAGMGEPTLNPNLPKFIAYFRDKIPTLITTNASALTARNIDRLIDAGLGALIVSFNGADAATYELMMGGLNFERAEKYLADAVRQAAGRMKVVANVSVTRQTRPHLAAIRRYLEAAGVDDISFSKCHSRGGHLKGTGICDTPMPPAGTLRCDIFDGTLFVAWNGDVLACCHDLDGVAKLGNLATDDLAAIAAYKQGLKGQGAIFAMCAACNDMYRFGNDPTPDRATLSDWVYDVCAAESGEPARLARLARERESQLRAAEQRAAEAEARLAASEQRARRAEEVVAGYERGRVIRLMRALKRQEAPAEARQPWTDPSPP